MKGHEQKFIKYIDGASKRFIIPVYQRYYNWQTEQCKKLYDDLVKIIKDKRKNHFFGSIVSVHNEEGEQEDYLIIDGQQRLTTVSLLLLSMHDLLLEEKTMSEDLKLAKKIYNKYLIDEYEPKETRMKLKPIKNDREAFRILFTNDKKIPNSNITINYQYFYDRIQKREISIDELYKAICSLEIINISLNCDDNPQLIFESLNSTGLDLNEGDKIRNFILMGLPLKKQEEYYNDYWNKIEVCTNYDVSAFVRDYLSMKQQITPNLKNVYFAFKEYIDKQNFEDIKDLLKDLYSYAKRYEILIKANSDLDSLNQCIYRLNRLETTVTRPFFLEVLRLEEENIINQTELISIFSIVETYIFRRIICDLPTNSLNKIFLLLHKEIQRFDETLNQYVEKLKYAILSKTEKSRFPDDDEFKRCISMKNIYSMTGKNKQYLFERLENAGTIETKDVWIHIDKGEYTIEHIMPQQLSHSWIKELGEDFERIHKEWLHRLANLTLTAYNTKYSNRSFIEKRDMENGFKRSGIRMNQRIAQKEKWTLEELEERNEEVIYEASMIWHYTETSFQPSEKQLSVCTLEDDIDLTRKLISKFSFKNVEYTVKSWVDMYQQILIILHQQNKLILNNLAIKNDDSIEMSNHVANKSDYFNSSRKIDENIYVWTNSSTSYKINLLRKFFDLYGERENDLIFYLKTEEKENEDISGTRFEFRKEYWIEALPEIRKKSGIFQNVNPSKSNWISGFIGHSGIEIQCIANFDSARVELYLNSNVKQKNKDIFDFLEERKLKIENNAGISFLWNRNSNVKSSKIYLELKDVSISNRSDWSEMIKFHSNGVESVIKGFLYFINIYFDKR